MTSSRVSQRRTVRKTNTICVPLVIVPCVLILPIQGVRQSSTKLHAGSTSTRTRAADLRTPSQAVHSSGPERDASASVCTDGVDRFLIECVVGAPKQLDRAKRKEWRIQSLVMSATYIAWARCNGVRPCGPKAFAHALKERGYRQQKSSVSIGVQF
jgi:hypothetical protein